MVSDCSACNVGCCLLLGLVYLISDSGLQKNLIRMQRKLRGKRPGLARSSIQGCS